MAPDGPPRSLTSGLAALVFVVSFAAFAPALQGGWVWDDHVNFTYNPHFRGLSPRHIGWMFSTFHGTHYQPLAWITHGLNYEIAGMAPGVYKLTNMLLHATGAMLFYLVLAELLALAGLASSGAQERVARLAAAACALLWSVHPLRAESVAWITERRGVLSGVFVMLSLLAYLRMTRAPDERKRRLLILSVLAYLGACLSKAWVMMFPVALVVLDAYPLRRFSASDRRRVLLEKIPFAVLGAATVATAFAFQLGTSKPVTLDVHSVSERLLQCAYGLVFYIWKTVLPTHLSPLNPVDHHLRLSDPRYFIPVTLLLGATALLVAKRRQWPGPLAAFAAYALLVFPMLGLMQGGPHLVADRYAYLSTMPLFALLAAGACVLLRDRPAAAAPACLVACVAAVALASAAWVQTRIWHDPVTMWSRAIEVNPRAWMALCLRGSTLLDQGRAAEALRDLDASIAITRRHPAPFSARCAVRLALGDKAGALEDGEEAVRVGPGEPMSYANRGVARRATGDLAGAMDDFNEALRLEPEFPEARCNRGLIHLDRKEFPAALDDFETCLALRPSYIPALLGRMRARDLSGDARGALADGTRLLTVLPQKSPQRRAVEEAVDRLRRLTP